MELIIDVDFNRDGDRMFGWYIYAYIKRGNNITSEYRTDIAMVGRLQISKQKYADILQASGSTILANGRTCFDEKETAQNVIPLLEKLIDYKLIF